MSKDSRNVGLAFLASLLLVTGIALALNLTFAKNAAQSACRQSYSLACII